MQGIEFKHSVECLLMPHPNASYRTKYPVSAADLMRLLADVRQAGLGRSTIYRLMATRHFPLPVKLAGRAVGWRRSDVERWTIPCLKWRTNAQWLLCGRELQGHAECDQRCQRQGPAPTREPVPLVAPKSAHGSANGEHHAQRQRH